MVAHLVWDQRV
ncbi:hypothetical protein VCHC67A1_00188A, partial [Vibrio cholerae HC-67A1]